MEIKIPAVGESVFEALIAKWHKHDGEAVRRDEPICEVETDKITLELNAEADGILSIKVAEGELVQIGSVIGHIIEAGEAEQAPVAQSSGASAGPPLLLSPAVRKLAQEKGISLESVQGSGRGGRVTVDDLLDNPAQTGEPQDDKPSAAPTVQIPPPAPESPQTGATEPPQERETRKPMTPIRKRIAERLLAARQQTAMLTTFNEVDMGRVIELRKRHQEYFLKKHGVKLGFMSFFVKACVEALREFPAVNARIDGSDIVYHNYYDIGIAVSGEKGLVVPVLRNAGQLHFAEIERTIAEFGEKITTNRLAISELEGGTFTISNGGVFGSLLSTPIINPPQTGVLGMHGIQERAVVRDGQIVVRPMMYLALSYDHRLIDGREAVQFLKKVKEYVEEPEELFLEG